MDGTTVVLVILIVGAFVLKFLTVRQEAALMAKAIELGRAEMLAELARRRHVRQLSLGLIVFGTGVGLVLGHYLKLFEASEHGAGGVAGPGLVLALVGLGIVISRYLAKGAEPPIGKDPQE